MKHWFMASAVAALIVAAVPATAAQDESPLWSALRDGGHVALMRHALAPGTGDPPNFDPTDCATQRNLSAAGRRQAAEVGAGMRAQGIARARVFSSVWCRCRETARLLALGPVQDLPALNSFFEYPERRADQTRALRDFLAGLELDDPVVLVTHQVNITALTGVYPTSGEIVIVRPSKTGEVEVLGRIVP